MLYQLFRKNPDKEIMNKILKCINLQNLNDTRFFTKKYLAEIEACKKIEDIKSDISTYYIPCKSKIYLNNLNEKKIITIIRHFIRYFNYFLFSKEKYMNGTKYIIYQINSNKNKNILKLKSNDNKYIVYFD